MAQEPPKKDARYRTHRSVRCYVGELRIGTEAASWSFDESAERVVSLGPGDEEVIVYKTRYHKLQPAERMVDIANAHFQLMGGVVTVGGKAIYWDDMDRTFQSYPFIDVTGPRDRARYREMIAKK